MAPKLRTLDPKIKINKPPQTTKRFFSIIAAGKKNRQKERRLMKGFNLSSAGASGGSVSTPIGGGGLPGQTSITVPSSKKSSLTIAPADIMIDMSAPKKSPMQR